MAILVIVAVIRDILGLGFYRCFSFCLFGFDERDSIINDTCKAGAYPENRAN